ncbi:hypothetical protein C8J56DRAFT_1100504 [Mycena floridula]|nr:hypothetical protein C8J56DRAFT_1100504 [Mycena floridula]
MVISLCLYIQPATDFPPLLLQHCLAIIVNLWGHHGQANPFRTTSESSQRRPLLPNAKREGKLVEKVDESQVEKSTKSREKPEKLKVLVQSLPKWHEKTTHLFSHKQQFSHWMIILAKRKRSLFFALALAKSSSGPCQKEGREKWKTDRDLDETDFAIKIQAELFPGSPPLNPTPLLLNRSTSEKSPNYRQLRPTTFTVPSDSGATTPPEHATQTDGQAVHWGTGALADSSTTVAAPVFGSTSGSASGSSSGSSVGGGAGGGISTAGATNTGTFVGTSAGTSSTKPASSSASSSKTVTSSSASATSSNVARSKSGLVDFHFMQAAVVLAASTMGFTLLL